MSFPKRRRSEPALAGHPVTVRRHRDLSSLLSRISEGDLVVLTQRDLDAGTARAIADRRPWAVVNTTDFISGRYANLGPSVLAEAGVLLFEADPAQASALRDGSALRLDGDALYDGAVIVADVRRVESAEISARMETARTGLAAQLSTFAHTATELLRHEEGALLHGTGLPDLATALRDRVVVVVGPGASRQDLRPLRRFIAEQRAVLVCVDGAADALPRRWRADLAILSTGDRPADRALERAREIVVSGAGPAGIDRWLESRNRDAHRIRTSLVGADLALLLAEAGGARLVVPVGAPATLEEFVDTDPAEQAGSVLTRLKLGPRLVAATAVPLLYTGILRRWHVALALAAAVAVLALAVAATPVGQDWWQQWRDGLPESWDWIR